MFDLLVLVQSKEDGYVPTKPHGWPDSVHAKPVWSTQQKIATDYGVDSRDSDTYLACFGQVCFPLNQAASNMAPSNRVSETWCTAGDSNCTSAY
mmetsp:Transcript_38738/g.81291  ORF Transcript_38738/g.81291 Transcript_38738/m.81291 type:complete len:94 (+) Transcript_38738:20-301(+)